VEAVKVALFCCGVNQRRWNCRDRPGTVVTVSNLFGTWPARRQGFHTGTTNESGANHTWANCLVSSPVTWQVWQNDREWFSISPGATTQQLPQLLRQVRLGDLQQLKVEIPTPQGEESDLTPYSSPLGYRLARPLPSSST